MHISNKTMLTLRYARQTRAFLSVPSSAVAADLLFSSSAAQIYPSSSSSSSSTNSTTSNGSQPEIHRDDIACYFREWFMSRKKPLFDRIFEILRTQDGSSADLALSRFNLHISEALILDVLKYQKKDVLSCLKFFDWAGRQPGFHHTGATFNAIFCILSKAKLMTLMLDFMHNYMKQGYIHKIRYYNILVIGYAVAGKAETALQLFGRMRFGGFDLDEFAYHVLMNSLVEQGYFDVAETVAKEIRVRGFQNKITHSIMIKSFCKQSDLERGEKYLHSLVRDDEAQLSGIALATYVDALCKDEQFERAALLVDEFRRMGVVSMEPAYGVWITNLVKIRKLDGALKFLKDKQAIEGYVPNVFRYNMLICRLLRENKFEEVYDMLADMKENEISPDDVTMNAILCFLCKMGRMDIALDLYDSSKELGLSVNFMAYNYLVNSLLGDGNVDEAYRVLRNSIEQGYLPGQRTFSFITDALCREGKLDKMKELVMFTLDHNIISSYVSYNKCISTLCRAKRVEDGYLVHNLLNNLNKPTGKKTYMDLIIGFSTSNRADIASRLLIEMQERGYSPSRKLVRNVICCLCKTENPEYQFFRLLEMHLSRHQSSASVIYSFFIDGAGHARKPELARQVYEMMGRSGIESDLRSDILVLQSYLKSHRIAEALLLYHHLSRRRCDKKLCSIMIIGLCKAKYPVYASQIMDSMKANELIPYMECYEELIKLYCDLGQYYKAIDLVNDMTQIGRPISSFTGNVFLLHALRTRKLYSVWAYLSQKKNLTPACWMLGHLIGVFSGCVEGYHDGEELEKLIQQCFHIDMYTNNMLLRRLSMNRMDHACKFFDRLRVKGYEPNRWTYDIIVHGLAKHGNTDSRIWMEKMLRKGFVPTESTQRII